MAAYRITNALTRFLSVLPLRLAWCISKDLMPTKMGTATTLFSNAAKAVGLSEDLLRALLRKFGITILFFMLLWH